MPSRAFLIACCATVAATGADPKIEKMLAAAGDNAPEIRSFIETAAQDYGAFGEKAAVFLVEGMPESDLRSLDNAFLLENLSLALKARDEFPWAKALPDDLFLNDVLPYASLDETREPWRREFYQIASPMVAGCTTAGEAAQVLNRDFFNKINVHYNTGRKAPNQSPSESRKLGMATCTGLSIILVDACRAVGVPARIAGTPLWSNKRGNHTWVEIHDGDQWRFTGADEYNKQGLDKAWFTGDAAKALADQWQHAIWASSWKPADSYFPLVWNPANKSVAAHNVTARYAAKPVADTAHASVNLRAWDTPGGERITVLAELTDQAGKTLQSVTTKAGQADLNDMPSLQLEVGKNYRLVLKHREEKLSIPLRVAKPEETTREIVWSELHARDTAMRPLREWLELPTDKRTTPPPSTALTREQAAEAAALAWRTFTRESRESRDKELAAKTVSAAGKQMRYLERSFGEAAAGKRALWISMHGGGGAPSRVNDRQWQNQIRLYQPKEGIVVAPRAPTDTWNLWYQGHIDDLFDRLIANFVIGRGVDPDRIYLMGYSAGGDGVYQLAPRMADRFAAAAMMAGHPNDASPLGLRNLPFMIFAGGNDSAYSRNKVAAEWGARLAALREGDKEGYPHKLTIYEGLDHWMNGKDAEALPWMAKRTRTAWPKKVVWHQSRRTHDRFYWLAVPAGSAEKGHTVRVTVTGQRIAVQAEGPERLILRLSDQLVNLDQPLVVTVNGKEKFNGKVERTPGTIIDSLQQRMDPGTVATGLVDLPL